MGSAENEEGRFASEGPARSVVVPGFFLGPRPVTNGEYQRFLHANPRHAVPLFWSEEIFNQPAQPVVGVTLDAALGYAEWAGLRLPSEAEWEYACRAGTTTRYFSGNDEAGLQEVAWYSRVAERCLHAAGEKPANAFGLHDMHGNVWEWCADDWHEDYVGAPIDGSAWIERTRGDLRVLRGGSWFGNHAAYLRSATRRAAVSDCAEFNVGFRCALSE